MNVYPLEVENALREHPGVEDVAVYAVDDDSWGQRVCAGVVGTATASELDAFARTRLAPAKRPKEYHHLDALPVTPTGKICRSAVVAAVRSLFGNPMAVPADAPWPLQHPILAATLWTALFLAVSIPLTIRRFRSRTTD